MSLKMLKNAKNRAKLSLIVALDHRLLLALIKIPFRRQKCRLNKNSDGFVRWLLFLFGIFDGEKDQILIQA